MRSFRRGADQAAQAFPPGLVYPALFLRRDELAQLPPLFHAQRFVVIRDLRDTLVSLYFSVKVSHPINDNVKRDRPVLESVSKEEGLRYLIPDQLAAVSALQNSWLGHDERIVRYEDLMADAFTHLHRVFIEEMKLPITPKNLRRAIEATRFEKKYKRKPGTVDLNSHGRQGAPGDWKRHFTPAIAEMVAEKFGQTLIDTGYEKDFRWVEQATAAAE